MKPKRLSAEWLFLAIFLGFFLSVIIFVVLAAAIDVHGDTIPVQEVRDVPGGPGDGVYKLVSYDENGFVVDAWFGETNNAVIKCGIKHCEMYIVVKTMSNGNMRSISDALEFAADVQAAMPE